MSPSEIAGVSLFVNLCFSVGLLISLVLVSRYVRSLQCALEDERKRLRGALLDLEGATRARNRVVAEQLVAAPPVPARRAPTPKAKVPNGRGLCQCGCGVPLSGKQVRWASHECGTTYWKNTLMEDLRAEVRAGKIKL